MTMVFAEQFVEQVLNVCNNYSQKCPRFDSESRFINIFIFLFNMYIELEYMSKLFIEGLMI